MGEEVAYLLITRGIMVPAVSVSTRTMKGATERTLWCEEKGVSQCTARLWTQTTKTGMLMGSTQSMRTKMECA